MVETEEDLANIDEDDLIMLLSVKKLPTSNSHDQNLITLRDFCRLDYEKGTCPNPFYQPLLDAVYVECYKRRVAATNENSQRPPDEYLKLYRYACEWRYGTALLVILSWDRLKTAEEIEAIWDSESGLGLKTLMFVFKFLKMPLTDRLKNEEQKEEKKGKKFIVSLSSNSDEEWLRFRSLVIFVSSKFVQGMFHFTFSFNIPLYSLPKTY